MPDEMENKRLSEESAAQVKPVARRSPVRLFAWFLIILILICGIFVLATNGLYYWFSRPIATVYDEAKIALDGGVPTDAEEEADRLGYYQSVIDRVQALPGQLKTLDDQAWTFAVLIREDFHKNIPAMLDLAQQGKKAVTSYFEGVAEIRRLADDFAAGGSQPPVSSNTLPAHVDFYADRLAVADRLDEQYEGLSTIVDIELAGRLFSHAELGLDAVTAEVAPYRQPVADLQNLIEKSNGMESELDDFYALNPSVDGQNEALAILDGLRSDHNSLLATAGELTENLPDQLDAVFAAWSQGLSLRGRFIDALEGWWRNSVLSMQSLDSARIDRATAKRYMADSLEEANVETAYLWTRTAEAYQESMITAINFANIYIDRANSRLESIADSRAAYRPLLGFMVNQRDLVRQEPVDPDAFWLGE